MPTLWYCLLTLMMAVYVLLDGFDIGAGIIHHRVARTDAERRAVLAAIGPYWDGNEVWLLAAGGTLYFAFPVLYASSFSGFYLPLMMVLWLLILRGVSIEFRSHFVEPLWRSLFDFGFAFSSVLLAIFLGAALGNVLRGVPLDAQAGFFEPLWTNFVPAGETGVLDWYTVLAGVVALLSLALHGAAYLVMKTEGDVRERSRQLGIRLAWIVLPLSALALAATHAVRPSSIVEAHKPILWAFPPLVVIGLVALLVCLKKGKDVGAFVSSCVYIVGTLGGAAVAMYPYLLPATTHPENSLTIYNAATSPYAMKVALAWFPLGMVLTTAWFYVVYRTFRGRVATTEADDHAQS
jgi:cytochrome d ubiquinol oxidase subunit II